jgi:hypothetical protein
LGILNLKLKNMADHQGADEPMKLGHDREPATLRRLVRRQESSVF